MAAPWACFCCLRVKSDLCAASDQPPSPYARGGGVYRWWLLLCCPGRYRPGRGLLRLSRPRLCRRDEHVLHAVSPKEDTKGEQKRDSVFSSQDRVGWTTEQRRRRTNKRRPATCHHVDTKQGQSPFSGGLCNNVALWRGTHLA